MSTIFWSGKRGPLSRSFGSLEIKSYPNGDPLVGFPEVTTVDIDTVMLRPTSMLDLMAGLFFVDALQERRRFNNMDLFLPFVPGARQDRLNDKGDFLFTAKSIAKEINARNFRTVYIIDPHSEVTPALIDRCHVTHAHDCVKMGATMMAPIRYGAVVSPDAGAEKRAGQVAKSLGIPLLHGWKTRDIATGAIKGFGLEPEGPLLSSKVLVVDDICDGGGTFIGLAGVLKERGIKADLYVTHGIFSQGTAKLLEHYDKVFCTDSIEGDRPGVNVIPMCDEFIDKLEI